MILLASILDLIKYNIEITANNTNNNSKKNSKKAM